MSCLANETEAGDPSGSPDFNIMHKTLTWIFGTMLVTLFGTYALFGDRPNREEVNTVIGDQLKVVQTQLSHIGQQFDAVNKRLDKVSDKLTQVSEDLIRVQKDND